MGFLFISKTFENKKKLFKCLQELIPVICIYYSCVNFKKIFRCLLGLVADSRLQLLKAVGSRLQLLKAAGSRLQLLKVAGSGLQLGCWFYVTTVKGC